MNFAERERVPPWLAAIAALVAGASTAFAFAPTFLWPVYALALTGLIFLLDDAAKLKNRRRAAFWRCWLFAFGAFLAGLNWIANAFFVDAEKFGALAIPALLALPACLGLFWGAAGSLMMAFWTKDARRLPLFTGMIALVELLRATILTGFPWNLPGHVWLAGGAMSQLASVVGVNGLSGVTLILAAAPAVWLGVDSRRVKVAVSVGAGLIFAGVFAFGIARLSAAGTAPDKNAPIIAVVDAGFTQKEKWLPENRDRVAQRYVALLNDPAALRAKVVVWPEGATPFPLLEDPPTLKGIDEAIGNRTLATGLVRRDLVAPGREQYFNSLVTIARDNLGLSLRSLYDKNHLVPFGEYVPFGSLFDMVGLRSLVSYGSDFTPGPEPTALAVPGAPKAWPLICYEAIFPIHFAKGQERPKWLLNVSIDAWYGQDQGPAQHFNQARYRAIETGLPLVRAASGGPTGIVDAYGRVVILGSPLGGVVSGPLPSPAPIPPFSGNDYFLLGLIAFSFALRFLRTR